jgi:hypothetical protein
VADSSSGGQRPPPPADPEVRKRIERRRKLAKSRAGSVASKARLLPLRDKTPGQFARQQAERARRAWFDNGMIDVDDWRNTESEAQKSKPAQLRLWNEYRRQEAGAVAEETVGRFADLLVDRDEIKPRIDGKRRLDGGVEVYHSVEMQGRGMPGGDIDHLIVAQAPGKRPFALVVETKYRLKDEEMAANISRVRALAAAVYKDLGWWTLPVLCSAAVALREGETGLGRYFIDDGRVLVTDALTLAPAASWIIAELDAFLAGNWNFPEHRTNGPTGT